MSNKNTPTITLRDLSFGYGTKTLIRNFSSTIESGERLRISGPSGSGKTTFLKLIGGILEPTTGTITVGKNTIGKDRFSLFGYHFVDADFFERMSVRDNILILSELVSVKIDMNWYNQLLSVFGMKLLENTELANLSAGQRERVGLIRAIVHKPQILLLDEPGSHLDESLQTVLTDFLTDYYQDTGATMIISSHGAFPDGFFDTSYYFHEDYHISLQRS